MPNESVKPKLTAIDRIMQIINKMDDKTAVETWQEVGDKIHQRLDANRQSIADLQSQLPKKKQ